MSAFGRNSQGRPPVAAEPEDVPGDVGRGTAKGRKPDRASGGIARPVRSKPRSGDSVRTS